MEETARKDIYIKCSRCKCKYHDNEENIKTDFGYNRLGVRYKGCTKCREKGREYSKLHNLSKNTHQEK